MDTTGKRLLVLGSTKLIGTIVKKAMDMGVYTIVTDNRPYEKAPAKQIANEYANIDFSDTASIKKLIQDKKIDGVLTGFTDSYMPYYLKICEENGLPCYGDGKQIAIATDKSVFKNACIDAGVPVIPGIATNNITNVQEFAAKIGFPIMIKPIDNSGSRGVIKCEKDVDLQSAFDYAMSFSEAGEIIAEKYMDCENIAVSYFAADGDIRLSTTDDRWMYHSPQSGSSVSSYSEYPSAYTTRYIQEVNDSVIKMLKNNGFRNGMVSLQAFVDEKSFYFCEMCFRPSGGQHYLLTQDQSGIDQLALLIEFAVTGECYNHWEREKETPFFKEHYAMLRILGTPERRIAKMDGFDRLLQDGRVLVAKSSLSVGTVIGKAGTTAQVIGSVLYKFNKNEDAVKVANSILEQLTIEDDNGESIAWISVY